MASKSKTSTITTPSDVVFEPYCEWKKEEGAETLVVHLNGFKKDQLRVQVNNLGVLKVSGEKPQSEDGKKKIHFLKETKIPQGCDINDIRAKFTGGQLQVIMPKKAETAPQTQQQQPIAATSSQAPPSEVTQQPEANASASHDQKITAPSTGGGAMGASASFDQPKDHMFGLGNSLARLKVQKKVAVSFGVAVAAVVAIGAYVAYRYGSYPPSSSPPHIED